MQIPLIVHGTSHPGLVHEANEDAWAIVPTEEGGILLLVCDGMGGMGHGDEASALAVRRLGDQMRVGAGYPPERLRQAIRQADTAIRETLCDQGRGYPGSTAVMVYVLDGMGHVAWVGDSRAYLIRDGVVAERTSDHKLVDELIAAGQLTEEEAKSSTLAHVVTRALGGRPPGDRPVNGATLGHPWKLQPNDVVVISSDGVCDLVQDAELPAIVDGHEPSEAAARLVRVALDRGGHDNITCIIARWEGGSLSEDDVATPLMVGPRGSLADLDDLASFDDRPGAERVTEELPHDHAHAAPTDAVTPPSGSPTRSAPATTRARTTPPVATGRTGWRVMAGVVLLAITLVGLALLAGR